MCCQELGLHLLGCTTLDNLDHSISEEHLKVTVQDVRNANWIGIPSV